MVDLSDEASEKAMVQTTPPVTDGNKASLKYLSYLAQWGSVNLHAGGRDGTDAMIERMALCAGQRVLDIGCGTGASMLRVAESADVSVDGADVLPEMIRCTRRRIKWCGIGDRCRTYLISAGSPLPLEDNSYDRIYTEGVIGFQSPVSVNTLLAEILRLLKPGGLYAANETVWRSSTPQGIAASVYRTSLEDFGLCQAGEEPWDKDRWAQVMEDAGFVVESCEEMTAVRSERSSGLTKRISWRQGLSHCITMAYRLRGMTRPRLIGQWMRYRRRLHDHQFDGQLVEARFFLLRKPS